MYSSMGLCSAQDSGYTLPCGGLVSGSSVMALSKGWCGGSPLARSLQDPGIQMECELGSVGLDF